MLFTSSRDEERPAMEELPPDETSGSIGNTLLRCIASKICTPAAASVCSSFQGHRHQRERTPSKQNPVLRRTRLGAIAPWSGKCRTPTLDGYLWSCGSCNEWPIACDISTAPSIQIMPGVSMQQISIQQIPHHMPHLSDRKRSQL